MARFFRVVGAIGAIARLFSYTFLLPAVISVFYDPADLQLGSLALPRGLLVFTLCAGSTFLLGTVMRSMAPDTSWEMRDRDAYLTVGLGWMFLVVLAMLPFLMMGTLTSPIDAFFEAMSGLTTTGATVIQGELELVSKSLMIWRALIQFIGGMGIIVLSVAVLSKLTQGGATLLQAEAPGPSVQRIAPRIARTASILWTVYAAVAGVLFVILFSVMMRGGFGVKQTIYEALLHTMTTVSTAGFSSHTASISYFNDWLVELVIIVFMLISGTNYTLFYYLLRGRGGSLLRDPEWRFFMTTFVVVTLAITGMVWNAGTNFVQALRDAAFTVASFITSTGYTTADYDQWPEAAKALILLLMVTGATAGSTGGGMKHVRVLILMRLVQRQFMRLLHPRAVVPIRLGGRVLPQNTLTATVAFFFSYVAIWFIGAFALLAIDPLFSNPADAASASIAALSNMGPALGVVGPTENYAGLAWGSKLTLSIIMWFGRLEIFAALLIFMPNTWRK